jgi:uncharacterized protein
MTETELKSCTVFAGHSRIASGTPAELAEAAETLQALGATAAILAFDDATGAQTDLDLHRLEPAAVEAEARGRGRPRLGVVAREITLLPRHWDWLNRQSGGASVALRKLVDQARRESSDSDRQREAREAAYRFISAMAGDFPGFEEASRALFAQDRVKFDAILADWPKDVSDYAAWLAAGGERK